MYIPGHHCSGLAINFSCQHFWQPSNPVPIHKTISVAAQASLQLCAGQDYAAGGTGTRANAIGNTSNYVEG